MNTSDPAGRMPVLKQLSDDELVALVVQLAKGIPRGDVRAHRDEPPSEVLDSLFASSDDAQRARIQSAVVQAIEKWYPADSAAALTELVRAAGFIRATSVVPHLRRLAESYADWMADADLERVGLIKAIVGVLGGFVPNRRAVEVLESLFFGTSVAARCSNLLFLALCEASPDRYTRYVERYISLLSNGAASARRDYTLSAFVESVTLPRIVRHFRRLSPDTQRLFVKLLTDPSYTPPVLEVVSWDLFVHGSVQLRRPPEHYEHSQIVVLRFSEAAAATDVACDYAKTMGPLSFVRDALARAQRAA